MPKYYHIIALIVFSLFNSSMAQENRNIVKMSHISVNWGESTGLGFIGHHLYATTSDGLKIINCNDLQQPRVVWEVDLEGSTPLKSAVSGELIALVDAEDRLHLLRVSPDGEPAAVGDPFQLSANIVSLSVEDNILAVSSASKGLEFFLIDGRFNLQQVELNDTSAWSQNTGEILMVDGVLYGLADIPRNDSTTIFIVDISQPERPEVRSATSIEGKFDNLKFSNGYLYLSDSRSKELISIDVRNQQYPYVSNRFSNWVGHSSLRDMAIWGSTPGEWEFVLRLGNYFIEADLIGDPANIQYYRTLATNSDAVAMAVKDSLIAVISSESEIRLYYLNEMVEMNDGGTLGHALEVRTMTEANGFLYAFDEVESIITVDYRDAIHPRLLSQSYAFPGIVGLKILDTRLFCLVAPSGCGYLSISQNIPIEPIGIAWLSECNIWEFNGSRIAFGGNESLILTNSDRFFGPIHQAELEYLGPVKGLFWNVDYLYIVTGDSSHYLWVFNTAEPARPFPLRRDLLEIDDFKFIVGDGDNLAIGAAGEIRLYDISTRLLIREQSRWQTDGVLNDILISDNSLIYADDAIRVVNIEDRAHPVFRGHVRGGERAIDLELEPNGLLYAAERTGVSLYDITQALSTPPEIHYQPMSMNLSAFPNPFNSSTTISYSLPSPGRYAIDVIDIQGRLVTRLSDGWKEAGSYREVWDGRNVCGGEYFIKLNSETGSIVRPLSIIK